MRVRRRVPVARLSSEVLRWLAWAAPAELARRAAARLYTRLEIRRVNRAIGQFKGAPATGGGAYGGGTNADVIDEVLGAGQRADAQLRDSMQQHDCPGSTANDAIKCAMPRGTSGRRSWERFELPFLQEAIDPRLGLPPWVDEALVTLAQLEFDPEVV